MAHINLLPWREARRQSQKKHYIRLLTVIAISGILCTWLSSLALEQLLLQQHSRNQFLQTQIAVLDAKIAQIKILKTDKQALEQKMRLVEQLQISRHATPTIFDHLAQLVPAGMTFISMSRTGNIIEIEGHSDSNNRLATFMRQLQQSPVFLDEELASIKADVSSAKANSQFRLTVMIAPEVAPMALQNETDSQLVHRSKP